jgi:hypothetical protein
MHRMDGGAQLSKFSFAALVALVAGQRAPRNHHSDIGQISAPHCVRTMSPLHVTVKRRYDYESLVGV